MEEPEASVYETSDIESEPDQQMPAPENEDIIESTIEYTRSFGHFENEFVDGKVNFDYVSHTPLKDSGFRAYRAETRSQKLARLRRELCELENEESGESVGELKELVALAQKLELDSNHKSNTYKTDVQALFDAETQRVARVAAGESKRAVVDVTAALELEKKVALLEERVGEVQSPLHDQVKDLARQINIIANPEYSVAQVQKDVSKLLEAPELGKLQTTNFIENYTHDKINRLVHHLPDIDQYIASSGQILKRLKALNDVHRSSIESHAFVANFDSLFASLSQEIDSWQKSLKDVNDKLDTSIDRFEQNKKEIEAWVNDLSTKVATLQ